MDLLELLSDSILGFTAEPRKGCSRPIDAVAADQMVWGLRHPCKRECEEQGKRASGEGQRAVGDVGADNVIEEEPNADKDLHERPDGAPHGVLQAGDRVSPAFNRVGKAEGVPERFHRSTWAAP